MYERKRNHVGRILLIEDNPGDVRLVQEAFKEMDMNGQLDIATDGVKALSFLRREGEYADALRPDLILLDLNLPKKSGHQVLKEIKSDDNLKTIPVVILTTSKAKDDIIKTYSNHGNCFIPKPVDLDQFIDVIQSIEKFWFNTARLPVYE